MLKKILLASVLLLPHFLYAEINATGEETVAAFDQSKSDSNTIWNNWFISIGAGAQLMNEQPKSSIDEESTSRLGSCIDDWVIPNTGVRTMHSGLSLRGARRNQIFSEIHANGNTNGLDFNPMNLHADILYNGSNLIFSYNEKREWKVIPYNTSLAAEERLFSPKINREISQSKTPVNIRLDINGIFLGNQPSYLPSNTVSATLGLLYDFPDTGWKNVKIPIHDEHLWKEHCNYMIYLNQK